MARTASTFGLSGCGRRGTELLRNSRMHAHCRAHAVHDPAADVAAALADECGIGSRCASFDELLRTGVDFVVLAGPPGDRLRQVEAAAEQGVHCLVAAPMAPDAATAAAMLRACDAAGVKLGVAVPQQGEPMMEQLRRMIADDWLGSPVLVQSIEASDRALWQPPEDGHWLLDAQNHRGAPLLTFVAEPLHLAVWLCERAPTAALALDAAGVSRLPRESAVAAVALRGGALCTFAASHATRGSEFAVHGTDGAVRIGPERVWMRGRKAYRGDSFAYVDPQRELTLPRRDTEDPLRAHFELVGRFARWIDDRDDFPCPGDQATLDMQALDAAMRALASRRVEDVQP